MKIAHERGRLNPINLVEIEKVALRASSLTTQLLAVSRKQVLDDKVLDLGKTVREIEPMLRRVLEENIQFEIRFDDDLGSVQGDANQITQVLLNLVVNARDAMPEGGRLIVEVRNLDLDRDTRQGVERIAPGRYVRLRVEDTGCGIPADIRDRVFEPFFTTKESDEGTGLGLSTAYGIVKQMGGCLTLASETDRGTSFEVVLPGPTLLPRPPRTTAPPEPVGGHERILVVEDDASVRRILVEILRSNGYRVLQASEGEQAIRVFESGPQIDLVVSDVVMPRMSGPELGSSSAAAR